MIIKNPNSEVEWWRASRAADVATRLRTCQNDQNHF